MGAVDGTVVDRLVVLREVCGAAPLIVAGLTAGEEKGGGNEVDEDTVAGGVVDATEEEEARAAVMTGEKPVRLVVGKEAEVEDAAT